MTSDEALQIFRETGALLEGHFILAAAFIAASSFSARSPSSKCPSWKNSAASSSTSSDTVVTTSFRRMATVIGQEVARQLRARSSLSKRRKADSRCGAVTISPEKPFSWLKMSSLKADECRKLSTSSARIGDCPGVAVIVDRSNGAVNFDVPTFSLIA